MPFAATSSTLIKDKRVAMRHLIPTLMSTVVVLLVAVAGLAHAAPPNCSSAGCVYLPLVAAGVRSTATPPPTATPTSLPPSFNDCQDDPNASLAPNYPVKIVIVVKAANPEVVRLQNTSAQTLDLTGWHMCSIRGCQEHDGIEGTLAPGQVKDFLYTGTDFIWNNTVQDDGHSMIGPDIW
jgi:hypothetical protein